MKLFIKESLLYEIDFENDFSDVSYRCLEIDELKNYLNDVLSNRGKKTQDRKKFPKNKPFIHAKSILFNGEKVDIEYLKKEISKEPNSVISSNSKMNKSSDQYNYYVSTSFPALRGLAYDQEKDQFLNINTCPGAGECATICYALKGNYIIWPKTYDLYTKRLNFLLNHPEKYEEKLFNELMAVANKIGANKDSYVTLNIRWNDSGDFFSKKYIEIAESILNRLDNADVNYKSYGYTKVAKAMDVGGSKMNYSLGGSPKEKKKLKNNNHSESVVIPNELAKGIKFNKPSDMEIYKKRVAEFFDIKDESKLLTYFEMLQTPEGDAPIYHVIVTPNDGDVAARRTDVKTTMLSFH